MEYLYHLTGKHIDDSDDSEPAQWWLDEVVVRLRKNLPNQLICGSCGMVIHRDKPFDYGVRKRVRPDPLGGTGGVPCIGYARLDFLHELGWDMINEFFYLGSVITPSGAAQEGVATFLAKRGQLFIRGLARSYGGPCDLCGQPGYYAMPPDKRHLVKGALTGDPVYQSDDAQLIITEAVFERIQRKKWPRLGVKRLPVLNEPMDGLPSRI